MLVYSNKLNSDFKIATVLAVSHKPETVGPHHFPQLVRSGMCHPVRDDAPLRLERLK